MKINISEKGRTFDTFKIGDVIRRGNNYYIVIGQCFENNYKPTGAIFLGNSSTSAVENQTGYFYDIANMTGIYMLVPDAELTLGMTGICMLVPDAELTLGVTFNE